MLRHATKKACITNVRPTTATISQQCDLLLMTSARNLRCYYSLNSCSHQLLPSLQKRNNVYPISCKTERRLFSEKPPPAGDNKSNGTSGENESANEIVLTPGQKVVATTRLTMWAGVAALALACSYYIGRELLPTKMSPNTIFDNAFSKIQADEGLKRRFGEKLKAYGRDHGGKREGRRNFIEHSEYTDKDDGSKRVRVRFNLEGQNGNAFVFAEVSNNMSSGEFVYLMVQDRRNGQVINLIDNRSALMAKRMGGDDAKGQDAFSNLLGVRK